MRIRAPQVSRWKAKRINEWVKSGMTAFGLSVLRILPRQETRTAKGDRPLAGGRSLPPRIANRARFPILGDANLRIRKIKLTVANQ